MKASSQSIASSSNPSNPPNLPNPSNTKVSLRDGIARVRSALRFATQRHHGALRHGRQTPYIEHPIAVCRLVHQVGGMTGSPGLRSALCAALLHDVIEDTETSYAEVHEAFGREVADLVDELTDDLDQRDRMGKLEYQRQQLARLSSPALTVKLCDRLHNISCEPTRITLDHTLKVMAHIRAVRPLNEAQRALIDRIEVLAKDRLARHDYYR